MDILQGYFTKLEAATYTRLSPRSLDYAREQGKLKAYCVGKRLLFSREDLDAFVRKQRVGADLDRIAAEATREVLGK